MHSRGTCRKLEERGAEETVNRTAGGTDKVSAHMNASSYTDLSIRESLTTVQSDRREDGASRDPTPLVENGVTLEEGAAGGHAVPRQSGEPGGQTKKESLPLAPLAEVPRFSSALLEQPQTSPRAAGGVRVSKKRPREEPAANASASGNLGGRAEGESCSEAPSGKRSEESVSERGGGGGGGNGSGGGGGSGSGGFHSGVVGEGRREAVGPQGASLSNLGGHRADVLKPLEDPMTDEVVLQDLATMEIRRVRRREASKTAPEEDAALNAARQRNACSRRSGAEHTGRNGDGSALPPIAAVANGVMPSTWQHQVNGKRVGVDAAGVRKEAGAGSGPGGVNQTRQGEKEGSGAMATLGGGAGASGAGRGVRDVAGGHGSGGAERGIHADKSKNGILGMGSARGVSDTATGMSAKAGVAHDGGVAGSGTAAADEKDEPRSFSRAKEEPGQGTGSGGDGDSGGGGSGEGDAFRKGTRRGEEPMDVETESAEQQRLEDEKAGGRWQAVSEGQGEEGLAPEKLPLPVPKPRQCPEHALPVARTFFDYDTVSTFEIRMLPEFFTGRSTFKTPEAYMQSRNYMVRTYQRMLEEDRGGEAYLTATECRRKLTGDVCSILRIHDFLDRFGLINTRVGGKRPPSYPIPPPVTNLWARPRRASESPTGRTRHGAPAAGGVRVTARGMGRGGVGGAAVGGDSATAGLSQGSSGVAPGLDEWDRRQQIRLMEAALANPDQWDVVAQQVGGGHSPVECLQRFLSLAVEDTLVKEETEADKDGNAGATSAPSTASAAEAPLVSTSEASAAAGGGGIPDASVGGATEGAATGSVASDSATGPDAAVPPASSSGEEAANSKSEGAPVGDVPGTRRIASTAPSVTGALAASRRAGVRSGMSQNRHTGGVARNDRSETGKRPDHLGPPSPALMLASALVSNVHPEVLEAAMTAATAAADEIARRSAGAWSSPRDRGGSFVSRGGGRDVLNDTFESKDAALPAGTDTGASSRQLQGQAPQPRRTAANGRRGSVGVGRAGAGALSSTSTPLHEMKEGSWAGVEDDAEAVEIERRAARLGAARAAVLSVAGLQARALADLEEKRTEALMADLLEARVQRLETKLSCLEQLDEVLEIERLALEHDRAELLASQARSMLSE